MLASSAAFACSSASSGVVKTYALRRGLSFSMRSRYPRVSSVEETSRRRTAAAWSSADANGSMAVNGADSYRGVGRGGQRALKCRGVLGRNGGEDATAGLGVAEHQLVELLKAAPIDLVSECIVVVPASRGKEIPLCKVANPVEEWHRPQFDVRTSGQVAQVSDQSITRDLCC